MNKTIPLPDATIQCFWLTGQVQLQHDHCRDAKSSGSHLCRTCRLGGQSLSHSISPGEELVKSLGDNRAQTLWKAEASVSAGRTLVVLANSNRGRKPSVSCYERTSFFSYLQNGSSQKQISLLHLGIFQTFLCFFNDVSSTIKKKKKKENFF